MIAILAIAVNESQLAFGGNPDFDGDHDGYSLNQGDCNDSLPDIHPGAPDILGDGIDQDCDGVDGTRDGQSIGGELMPLDSTSLLIVGIHANTSWLIPVVFSIVGIGLILFRRK